MNTKRSSPRRPAFPPLVPAAIILIVGLPHLRADPPPIPPAPGPHARPAEEDFREVTTFRTGDRLVGTYYFYWYDSGSGAHVFDGDGTDALTTHPPPLRDFSYKSVAWHRRQLEDMMEAGIDFLLPVFWGAPSEHDPQAGLHWSYEGLPPLVQARDALLAEGKSPPRIGMFYDTSTLRHNRWHYHADLTTDYGRQWFSATIRDFFSMIPPRHWAMIDGQPVVLLYSAAFARNHDQGVIDFTRREFARQFAGRRPWIAREVSWQVEADNTVAWGGALGLRNPGIASLGPGYDHSAVPGRAPLVVERKDGAFYEENWQKLLRFPVSIVMVETWNEFHEGTDIAESKEYGRRYIELTGKYARLFKQGYVPPWPKGEFTDADHVSVQLGERNRESGLRQVDAEDGATEAVSVAGRVGRAIRPKPGLGRYLYLQVDDSFKRNGPARHQLEVEYFDAAPGQLALEFDGSDRRAPFQGAYSPADESVPLVGDRQWKTARFTLEQARFLNRQNAGADLRLVITGASRIVVARLVLHADDKPSPP